MAFLGRIGGALVVVVVGDVAVVERCRLVGGQQAVVLQHVERHGPRLVRVHDHARPGDAVDRRVDAAGGELDDAITFERLAVLVEHDHVARPGLGPVEAEGQDEEPVVAAGDRHREVVVDPFFQLMQHRQAVRGGEVDLRLGDGISAGGGQGMDVHPRMVAPLPGACSRGTARAARPRNAPSAPKRAPRDPPYPP